jgi:hypothetical protein
MNATGSTPNFVRNFPRGANAVNNVLTPRVNISPNVKTNSPAFDFMSLMANGGWMIVVVLVLIVVIAIYYQTVGYYINLGWEKLKWSHDRGEEIEIKVPGGDVMATLSPTPVPSTDGSAASPFASLEAGLSKLESDVESALGGGGGSASGQVFNVARNVYTFHEAEPLCKAFGAQLATYDQVKEAHKAGADWCNYGWVKGQLAVYPTQKSTYDKLQHGPEHERMSCGRPGVNGGYFPNAEQRFGVNCYGPRPAESALDERIQMEEKTDIAFDREVNKYKAELDSIGVNPWNSKSWSG